MSGILLAFGAGLMGMLAGSIVSIIIVHLLTIFFIRRIVNINILNIGNINSAYLKRLFQFGGTVFSGTLINMLFSPFNKLMLSRYVGVASLPVYEISYTGCMRLRSLVETGLRALVPQISHLSTKNTYQAANKILEIYHRSIKAIIIFGTPFYLVLLVVSPFLLKIWLGKNFIEILPGAFQIMLVGTFLSLISVPAYYTFIGINKVGNCLVSHLIQAIANFSIVIIIAIFVHPLNVQNVVLAVIFGMSLSSFYLIKTLRIIMVKK